METASETTVLTIRQVAEILHCSKTHVVNVMNGRIPGLPRLTHLRVGRRKLIRSDWLYRWMEENKTR